MLVVETENKYSRKNYKKTHILLVKNMKDFDPNNIKIAEKSCENIHWRCDDQKFEIRKN